MDRKIFLFVSLFAFLFLMQNVFALGTFPGKTNIDFVPGLSQTISFTVVNSEQKNITVVVSVQGELEEYVTIPETVIKMSSNEASKEVSYQINLPQELPPGIHSADVVIIQLPDQFIDTGQMSVGAAVAVLAELNVNVPYPGKFAEGNINILGPESDGSVQFVVTVNNKGEFDIMRAVAAVDIYTSLNEKVATVNTNEISLLSKQRGELVAKWDSRSLPSGRYIAKANVVYDEKTFSVEKEFGVGRQRLILEGIEVNDFKLGEIAKFEVLVQNEWSERIDGAFVEMIVYSKDGNILADFKSQNYDIESLNEAMMVAFWDTEGVKEDTYDSKIFLRYAGASDEKELSLDVSSDAIEIIGFGYVISKGAASSSNLIYILIGVIVLLVVANLSWFLLLRKKIMKK